MESVASSKQIVAKTFRTVIIDLIELISVLSNLSFKSEERQCMASMAGDRWAYLLTEETKLPEALEDILIKNAMNIGDTSINEVKAHGQEVRMTIIQNRIKPGVSVNCDPTV